MIKLSPSILSADFANLESEIKKIEVSGVDYIHVDVIDGVFAPNITMGIPTVKALKKITKIPLDVHLMIVEPEKHIDAFIEAGADLITFHIEATNHAERLLRYIKSKGIKSGISYNPQTPLTSIYNLIGAFDLVLIMSVNPGFSAQKLIPSCLDKLTELKNLKAKTGENFIIELDGGVSADNIAECYKKGAELIVAGNAVFGQKDPANAVRTLLDKCK
jgi:ribulose-phosphate 3-epimerase